MMALQRGCHCPISQSGAQAQDWKPSCLSPVSPLGGWGGMEADRSGADKLSGRAGSVSLVRVPGGQLATFGGNNTFRALGPSY